MADKVLWVLVKYARMCLLLVVVRRCWAEKFSTMNTIRLVNSTSNTLPPLCISCETVARCLTCCWLCSIYLLYGLITIGTPACPLTSLVLPCVTVTIIEWVQSSGIQPEIKRSTVALNRVAMICNWSSNFRTIPADANVKIFSNLVSINTAVWSWAYEFPNRKNIGYCRSDCRYLSVVVSSIIALMVTKSILVLVLGYLS